MSASLGKLRLRAVHGVAPVAPSVLAVLLLSCGDGAVVPPLGVEPLTLEQLELDSGFLPKDHIAKRYVLDLELDPNAEVYSGTVDSELDLPDLRIVDTMHQRKAMMAGLADAIPALIRQLEDPNLDARIRAAQALLLLDDGS